MNLYQHFNKQVSTGEYTHSSDEAAMKYVVQDTIKVRILIERAVIRKLATMAVANGLTLYYSDGESGYSKQPDVETFMAEIGACDEEGMMLKTAEGKKYYFVLIYGNDGYDVIVNQSSSWEDDFPKLEEELDSMIDQIQEEIYG